MICALRRKLQCDCSIGRTAQIIGAARWLLAPLRERAAPDLMPAFLVPLTKQDWPTAAVIDLSRIGSLDPQSVAGDAGQLTRTTLATLTTAMRTYFGAAD